MSEKCSHNCSECSSECNERTAPRNLHEKLNGESFVKKVIGVVSGKGGVGKSLVTALMAASMQKKGFRSAVLDADITGPSIPKIFGIKEKAIGTEKGIQPAETVNGTKIMSINLLLDHDTDPVVWRGPMIAGVVKQFWTDVVWGNIDYMFVGKAVKMAGMLNIPVLGIVENMSYFECPTCHDKHYILGNSHIEELAEQYNIRNIEGYREGRKILNDHETILDSMPVSRAFLKLAVPAVAAQLINVLYNLVDKMFIGHIPKVGKQALAGVGVTTPVILAISAFAALVSMGGAPKASIFLGKGEKSLSEKVLGSCTWMLLLLSLLITAIMLAFGRPILLLFGASKDTIGFATDYMNIYCLGTVFTQLTLGLNTFITAQGKTLVSMRNVAIGALTNIVLDALLINGFQMGVRGAALATVFSQGVSAFFVISYLCSEKSVLRLNCRIIRFDKRILWPCILLGTSPALMQLTENLVAISFNTSLQKYGGDMAVASMSILNSVMQFIMLLLPGLVQGAQPLLSYNLGSGNIPRVKKIFRLLLLSCVMGSFLIWLLCIAAPGAVACIFTNDIELIKYSEWSMRIYLSVLLIYGIQVACQYSFVALDQAGKAIFLTIWRKLILLIPLIFVLPLVWPNPTMGVYMAEPVADTIAVCTTAPIFYKYYRALK